GSGLPNASIAVLDGSSTVATATADGSGNWSAALSLAIGTHILSATQTVNGRTSAASNTVALTVLPAPPTITSPVDGTSTTNGNVTVSGSGLPNASIAVLDGSSTVATATADGSGNWSAALSLAIGTHILSATQTVNGQTSAASNTVSLTVLPAPPTITSPVDGTSTTNGNVTVSGSGLPNASIAVLDGSSTVATATADGSGNWSAALSLAIGTHILSA